MVLRNYFVNSFFSSSSLTLRKTDKKNDKRAKWEQGQELKRRREEENAMTDDDIDQLFKEARLLKRRKKGKLTEEYASSWRCE
jgi:hypothetical protein